MTAHANRGYVPYTITNVNSGKLAEPSNCSTANGTGIVLGSSAGNTCQEWDIRP